MLEPMQHERRRFFGDLQITGQSRTGNAVLVARDVPDSHEPMTERQHGILTDSPDLDANGFRQSPHL